MTKHSQQIGHIGPGCISLPEHGRGGCPVIETIHHLRTVCKKQIPAGAVAGPAQVFYVIVFQRPVVEQHVRAVDPQIVQGAMSVHGPLQRWVQKVIYITAKSIVCISRRHKNSLSIE